jgi:hypothetical protein
LAILAWREIGNISLTKNWQYTAPTDGSYFRISHTIGDPVPGTLRAAIGQSIEGIVFDRRLIGYKPGMEEGQFFTKPENIARTIAIQRLDDFLIGWIIKIEELIDLATQLPLSIDDIENLRLELNAKAAITDLTALAASTTTALGGKAPISHQHQITDVAGLAIALGEKAIASDVTTALAGKSPVGHGHGISDVTGLQTSLDTKAIASEVTTALAGKSPVGHGHGIGDVTGLQTSLDAKADKTELPKLSTTPPSNPTAGTIWSELLSSNRVETWIYINSKWQSLSTYKFDFPSKDSFGNGFYSLFLPLDHRYDYLFIQLSTYCDYNGSSPINATTDFFKVVIWVTSDATLNVVADTGALPNSELKKVVAINTIFSPTDKEFLEHRVLKTGSAPGTRIASSLTYRLIRK